MLSICVAEIKRRERNGRGDNDDNDGRGEREEDCVVSRRKWGMRGMKINSRAILQSRSSIYTTSE